MIRRIVVWIAIGFALGTFTSMWLAPKLLAWRFTMPGGGLLQCGPQVQAALHEFVQFQLIAGVSIGLLLGVMAGIMAGRKQAPPESPQ